MLARARLEEALQRLDRVVGAVQQEQLLGLPASPIEATFARGGAEKPQNGTHDPSVRHLKSCFKLDTAWPGMSAACISSPYKGNT